MREIVYLHGLESRQGGPKVNFLATKGFVYAPSIDYKNFTYNDFYTECEKMWKHPSCNHRFLESIYVDENNVITMGFGS